MGSKRSSWKAEIKVYWGSTVFNSWDEKVPMHPRRSSSLTKVQVTKRGTEKFWKEVGHAGIGWLVSFARMTSKQYLQWCLVALKELYIKI